MEIKKYKITFSNGFELNNLSLNGNNFISKEEVVFEALKGISSSIRVHDGEKETLYRNTELVQVDEIDGEYWILFRTLTQTEINEAKIKADIDYMAMMTDVDLEEA